MNPGSQLPRRERGQDPDRCSQEPAGEYVEREVHPEVDARHSNPRGQDEHHRAQARAEDGDGGRRGERGGAVARGKRRVLGYGDQRSEPRLRERWTGTLDKVLERRDDDRGTDRREGRSGAREWRTAAPQVGAEAERHEQRSLDPPRRQQHEQRREHGVLDARDRADQRAVELQQRRHRESRDATTAGPLLVVVNARASGVGDAERTAAELVALLQEHGRDAEGAVTRSEAGLWQALLTAESRRVVLVGGDGSLHSAANAPLPRLPELALVPAGRANNVARALGIPTDRLGAIAVAAEAPARRLDALLVETPAQRLYAVEAVSAGFHAAARAGYTAENSADLRQGLRALALAVLRYSPYEIRGRVDGVGLASAVAGQLFVANLPYFGFGFRIAPGADPRDGRLDAILIEARGRSALLRLLRAVYRGRHLGRSGVRVVTGRRAELTEPLPLVADATPLGTTTAAVSVEPGRLRVAVPARVTPLGGPVWAPSGR
jgi:diacylglycerol kinase (ATP)